MRACWVNFGFPAHLSARAAAHRTRSIGGLAQGTQNWGKAPIRAIHLPYTPHKLHTMPLALRSAVMAQTACACCSGGAHKASAPRAARANLIAARANSRRTLHKAEARRQRSVVTHAAAADGEIQQLPTLASPL